MVRQAAIGGHDDAPLGSSKFVQLIVRRGPADFAHMQCIVTGPAQFIAKTLGQTLVNQKPQRSEASHSAATER